MPERTPAGLFEGTLLRRGDPGYDRARADAVWNGLTPERFPEVILQATAERDIPLALAWARAQGLRVSTRSGGHNWSGSQLRDGGLLIEPVTATPLRRRPGVGDGRGGARRHRDGPGRGPCPA